MSASGRRVLICEDSQTYAAGLSRLLSRDPDIEVIGVCSSAEETLARLATVAVKPDLVTMDLELPGMSGGDAIEQIMNTQPVPILVVQHMAAGFTESFTRWLDDQVPLPVRLAAAGAAGPGIWVAPEGAHLVLEAANRLALDDGEHPGLHRPSGDVLLRSVAAGAGAGSVAVVLTGMGRDGADGLAEVKRAGGLTIAQDEASSAVFGMPKAAAERGAELVLAPADIGRRLRALQPVGAP